MGGAGAGLCYERQSCSELSPYCFLTHLLPGSASSLPTIGGCGTAPSCRTSASGCSSSAPTTSGWCGGSRRPKGEQTLFFNTFLFKVCLRINLQVSIDTVCLWKLFPCSEPYSGSGSTGEPNTNINININIKPLIKCLSFSEYLTHVQQCLMGSSGAIMCLRIAHGFNVTLCD